jgi:hypothetical protein
LATRPDPAAILEAWESDWALGELLHLIYEGKGVGIMAHELDPALFSECMRVIGSEPFELRQKMHRIIMDTQYWQLWRFERIGGRVHRVRNALA